MPDQSNKRKQPSSAAPAPKRPRFQPQGKHISTTPSSKAYPNDEVNVSRFVRAHEREILALETAMKAAKNGQMRRAFQDVPRDMRRRTASHNPRRVTKRLRPRAKKEMIEDNTPIARGKSGSGIGKGKVAHLRKEGMKRAKRRRGNQDSKSTEEEEAGRSGGAEIDTQNDVAPTAVVPKDQGKSELKRKKPSLATPSLPPAKFRKRQIHKCWLPTHLFHTKRAHMTLPKEPLWRFAIALTPTLKTYRLTHRAATLRGAVAWDMSYISTISIYGPQRSMTGVLKALHFCNGDDQDPWENRGKAKKWLNGTRSWEGWLYEREGAPLKGIAPVTVIWCATDSDDQVPRRLFIRVHPSAFLQLWNELLKVSKVQKPALTVEDLRFEIGSIEITGPGAIETLCSVLSPLPPSEEQSTIKDRPEQVWKTLGSVTNLGALPQNALLGFSIGDPRLRFPPRATPKNYDASKSDLTTTLASWPVDSTQLAPSIFDRNYRLAAGRSLPSQKSINRRKGAASPGEYPTPRTTDPRIPILAFVSSHSNSWTVLLPWKCVMPVWRSIMYYPLSTGGNPKFGGLVERRQLFFERSTPWFPADFPGTAAGWTWELQQRMEREKEWLKRPKGKRIEWESIDLGNKKKGEIGKPWSCDWERFLPTTPTETDASGSSFLRQLYFPLSKEVLTNASSASEYISSPHIFTVRITMVQRGVPTNCARIYRLPTTDPQLRKKWLSLGDSKASWKRSSSNPRKQDARSQPAHLQRKALAASLLEPHQSDDVLKAGHPDYPAVPDEHDLIGYVTTGNYNLAEGAMTAVANLHFGKVMEKYQDDTPAERQMCIIRNAGHGLGRLARWEVVG